VEERDDLELRLYAEALSRDLPVFGICRGLQLMNVAAGGSLYQDIGEKHHKVDHGVAIERSSRICEAAGTVCYEVVSRHHQAIHELGAGLKITARAADGVIEGIEMEDREFVLGVQWHPEDGVKRSEADRNLFLAFARAVRGKAGRT
jgi:putative glutamine amidotransferase